VNLIYYLFAPHLLACAPERDMACKMYVCWSNVF